MAIAAELLARIIRAARDMLPNPEHSITSITKLLGGQYRRSLQPLPDLRELRASRIPA